MNSFGRIFRLMVYGESHGKSVGVIIDGTPPGIKIDKDDFREDLEKRSGGYAGTSSRVEADIPQFLSGTFEGRTTGAPLNVFFANSDVNSVEYEKWRFIPRPGHSDFSAFNKFRGFNDFRGGGHFSGRMTVVLVAAGVIAKKILGNLEFSSSLLEIGGEKDIDKIKKNIESEEDSVGGIVECRVRNVPTGLGEPFFDSVESRMSHILFSIPGIKGVEFGSGFSGTRLKGSENNDQFINSNGKRSSNNAGGVEGGITNGMDVVFRVAVKPTSTIFRKQKSINLKTGKEEIIKISGRHDKCIALRVPVILEASAAIVLADLLMIRNITGGPANL